MRIVYGLPSINRRKTGIGVDVGPGGGSRAVR
ncbi:hypothetical protein SAMN05216566_10843 [Aureimonas phyllosphaerae]|nr:hypothetical protein SAMN05216566_10843 [Aureimonas phyllosphaerae]